MRLSLNFKQNSLDLLIHWVVCGNEKCANLNFVFFLLPLRFFSRRSFTARAFCDRRAYWRGRDAARIIRLPASYSNNCRRLINRRRRRTAWARPAISITMRYKSARLATFGSSRFRAISVWAIFFVRRTQIWTSRRTIRRPA